jgi:hypothetical protein
MDADERWNRGVRHVHDIPIRRIACSPWDAGSRLEDDFHAGRGIVKYY